MRPTNIASGAPLFSSETTTHVVSAENAEVFSTLTIIPRPTSVSYGKMKLTALRKPSAARFYGTPQTAELSALSVTEKQRRGGIRLDNIYG